MKSAPSSDRGVSVSDRDLSADGASDARTSDARTSEGQSRHSNDRGERGDRNGRDRGSRRGRRRGRRDDASVEVDPWNRVDAEDPNYGRFLAPQKNNGRRGPQRGNGPQRNGQARNGQQRNGQQTARGESLADRSERGRGRALDRSQNARDSVRRSGEARGGVAYTPVHNRSESRNEDEGRNGRSRRRRRDDRGKRRNRDTRAQDNGTRDRNPRPSGPSNETSVPRVWKEDTDRRQGHHRLRQEKRGPETDRRGRQGDPRNAGAESGPGATPRELDALGVIGPVDPSEIAKELEAIDSAGRSDRNTNRCRIMARDPYWIHAYWELYEDRVAEARSELGIQSDGRWVLRVHSLPSQSRSGRGGQQPPGFFDIDVDASQNNAYVHVGIAERDYRVDLGVVSAQGLFFPLASSNRVTTPPDDGGQPVGDKESFYEKSGGAPTARIDNPDPTPMHRDMDAPKQRVRARGRGRRSGNDDPVAQAASTSGSGGVSVLSSPVLEPEPGLRATSPTHWADGPKLVSAPGPTLSLGTSEGEFDLVVQTELIVSGATDPNAQVTIQGIPVELREDGSFTVRFELNEGGQTVPVVAVSEDESVRKTITPKVTIKTTMKTEDIADD